MGEIYGIPWFWHLSNESHYMRKLSLLLLLCLMVVDVHALSPFQQKLAVAAESLTRQRVIYDPAYVVLPYPNGDVPPNKGVCTDVVIRAYRKMGIDLQRLVHEDMKNHFKLYPQKWGMSGPDKNIDHRRVPNLMVFFSRKGTEIEISNNANDYQPGDEVAWDLGNRVTHIGIVSSKRTRDNKRHLMVHNIGQGQVLEDCLFSYTVIGHYRYGK
jgi:uncharacterized protein YijF (DUF1287 family)